MERIIWIALSKISDALINVGIGFILLWAALSFNSDFVNNDLLHILDKLKCFSVIFTVVALVVYVFIENRKK